MSDTQLQQAVEQMERMCRAVATLHADILPRNRQQFALLAEGPLDELRRLEAQVSAYIDESLDRPQLDGAAEDKGESAA